jgi:MATE family multidrug resistance protein
MTLNDFSGRESSWWGRRGGGREVLRVAMPLVVSSLSWTVMTFCDRMMIAWQSPTAMAAAFAASAPWFAMLCLPLGICSYANTFVAQYDGARQQERIGPVVWQAVWIAIGFIPFVLVAVPLSPHFFALAGHEVKFYTFEVQYFQILCAGAPAMLIAQSSAAFYSGRGQTWVVMIVDAAFAALNLALDYCWIFGYCGFPEWGLAGAAWATVVSLWIKSAIYVVLPLQRCHREQFGTLRGMRIDWELIRRVLHYGGPSGLQMLLDVTGFTVFILLVARLGEVEAEATSMAFSVSTLAFMPIYGLHIAVSVLVGERLGENRDDLAARATFTTLQISWLYMIAISAAYALLPGLFLTGFFPRGAMTVDGAATYGMAVMLLRFVAAYNVLDATQMVFVGAIKGAGDTGFVFRVSLLLASILAGGSYLAVEIVRLDVYGCWMLITLWVWIAAAIYAARFRQGHWRRMRVIEQDAIATQSAVTLPEALGVGGE